MSVSMKMKSRLNKNSCLIKVKAAINYYKPYFLSE